jgi:hypothetical protein
MIRCFLLEVARMGGCFGRSVAGNAWKACEARCWRILAGCAIGAKPKMLVEQGFLLSMRGGIWVIFGIKWSWTTGPRDRTLKTLYIKCPNCPGFRSSGCPFRD